MKNIRNIILRSIVGLGVLLISACNFLDIVPEKNETVEYAFGERKRAYRYLATVYSYLPQYYQENGNPGRTVGPEVYTHTDYNQNNGNRITVNGNNINSPLMNYWDGGGGVPGGTATVNGVVESRSKDLFNGIRCCNVFLENIHRVPDLSSFEKRVWAAEVKFLKAYYHWWLMQLYGPIPTIRESPAIDAPTEVVMVFRDPLDETMDYIIELIDEAIEDLPDVVISDVDDLGRITRQAALAMKAKMLTYHASPFYNGNTAYVGFRDKRGVRLFPDRDDNKWIKARDACLEAIELCEQYTALYAFDPGLGIRMTDSTKFVLRPQGVVTDPWNRELIWGYSNMTGSDIDLVVRNSIPMATANLRSIMLRSSFAPTLTTIETFYSANGVPIEEDIEWRDNGWYDNRYSFRAGDDQHRYVIQRGEETAVLHFNREYRFYGSVMFDRILWYADVMGASLSETNQAVIRARGSESPAGKIGTERFSITGYYIKKLASYQTTNSFNFPSVYSWPIIRLSDLYLLYAEALNETLPAPTDEVWEYVNRVRVQAGLPTVQDSWDHFSINPEKYKTKNGMRDIIHQERMIELAFEGHYYFDIKRWSGGTQTARYDIMTLNNQPIRGWNIDGPTAADYYSLRNIVAPKFTFRDYLWPIREASIVQNTNLVQNPGW